MTAVARLFWALFALSLAVYVTMLVWTIPALTEAAGGLRPFDMRPGGYSEAEARAFLRTLTAEGRALYLGAQQRLDTVYPALMALTLSVAFLRLAPTRAPLVAAPAAAAAWAGAAFDYLENARVRGLLSVEPAAVTADAVADASRATVLKSVFDTLAFAALFALLGLYLVRRRRGARR